MSKSVPLSSQLPGLLEKMRNVDPDYRVMALVDLKKELDKIIAANAAQSSRRIDPHFTDDYTEGQLVDMVLKLLADSNQEVKSNAVTNIALIVKKARPTSLSKVISSLLDDVASSNDERRDTSTLALKSVVLEMPSTGPQVSADLERISSRVLGLFNTTDLHPQIASELLQTLTDLFTRFSADISTSTTVSKSSLTALIKILSTARPAIRKRAIPTLASLVAASPALFNETLQQEIIAGVSQSGDGGRVWLGAVASLARGRNVGNVGRLAAEKKLAEIILQQTKDPEDVETVEAALTALEALVLRCPTEMGIYISTIIQKSLALLKYDPNYVDNGDDDDVDMASDEEEGEEEEDDEYEGADYSDDDDDSWKIRRSAARLLLAIISTRPDLLSEIYGTSAPVLISRFSEREESVRLEVLAACEVLLKQTTAVRTSDLVSSSRNKRKRSEGMDEDYASDDGPIPALRSLLPQLSKATLSQLSSKSVPTRQQCFVLLRQMVKALGGGLADSVDPICTAAASALRSVDSATSSSLAIATLSFLAVFFENHPSKTFAAHLNDLVPAIVRCQRDKLQRISYEAFDSASALASSARSLNSNAAIAPEIEQAVRSIFEATTDILGDNTIDGDVREKALSTLGNILVHTGDLFAASYSECLGLISNRLSVENSAPTAISVIGQVASSPLVKGLEFEDWLLETLPQVVIALRRAKKGASKNTEFACLTNILERIGSSLPVDTAEGILVELGPLIDTPTALQTVALILSQQPASRSAVDKQLFAKVLAVLKSSINPHLVESLVSFFSAYAVALDGSSRQATKAIQQLTGNLNGEKGLPDATHGGTAAWATTAKGIGAIVKYVPSAAAENLQLFEEIVQSGSANEADAYLALLCVGEVGRITDLSSRPDLFDRVLSYFKSDSEEVRSAAAFAAGNLAVGTPNIFLPTIINKVEAAQKESERLLLLHAVKEVILHSPSTQLENIADSLWKPLFAAPTSVANNAETAGDDGIRNVTAACIGKLTITAPAKFLPQLQQLLQSSSPANRALVAAAVRYTFIDTSNGYDELISPIIVDFLSLMKDENLIVRRLSLASLNAAIQNKPHLIVDKLDALQPLLYGETYVKKELQREVIMGPWKVIEDDGLENRKAAYETMYTLLGTCFSKIDLPTFTNRVLASLSDVNEVKVLGLMLLLRLGQTSPEVVQPRLDEVVGEFQGMMKDVEVKDDTVKQDLERKAEMQRSTLRTVVPLYRACSAQQAPGFHQFVTQILANEKWKEFKEYYA
ncbi:hypothetical protein IAR50_005904 [Cryptococcus sp. DSM 104548]